jgi:hypothetical protein
MRYRLQCHMRHTRRGDIVLKDIASASNIYTTVLLRHVWSGRQGLQVTEEECPESTLVCSDYEGYISLHSSITIAKNCLRCIHDAAAIFNQLKGLIEM